MAKYDPLKHYLETLEVELSIEQLDAILRGAAAYPSLSGS